MPDPHARELRTATGPRGREDGHSRTNMANATAGTATLARPILSNRSPTRPRKSRCSGCALGRLQSALVVPSGRSGGTLGGIYRKVAVWPIEKCLFSVRSVAGPSERISVSRRQQRWRSNGGGGLLRGTPPTLGTTSGWRATAAPCRRWQGRRSHRPPAWTAPSRADSAVAPRLFALGRP